MDINQKIKTGLGGSKKKLEDFIEKKGIGSTRLKKAKKIQHNFNFAMFAAGIMSVAGVTFWALKKNNRH